MILFFFIVYKKKYTIKLLCIEHQQLQCQVFSFTLPIARNDDTHWIEYTWLGFVAWMKFCHRILGIVLIPMYWYSMLVRSMYNW